MYLRKLVSISNIHQCINTIKIETRKVFMYLWFDIEMRLHKYIICIIVVHLYINICQYELSKSASCGRPDTDTYECRTRCLITLMFRFVFSLWSVSDSQCPPPVVCSRMVDVVPGLGVCVCDAARLCRTATGGELQPRLSSSVRLIGLLGDTLDALHTALRGTACQPPQTDRHNIPDHCSSPAYTSRSAAACRHTQLHKSIGSEIAYYGATRHQWRFRGAQILQTLNMRLNAIL